MLLQQPGGLPHDGTVPYGQTTRKGMKVLKRRYSLGCENESSSLFFLSLHFSFLDLLMTVMQCSAWYKVGTHSASVKWIDRRKEGRMGGWVFVTVAMFSH